MANKSYKCSLLSDGLLFASGAGVALLLFFAFYSFFSPSPPPSNYFHRQPLRQTITNTNTTSSSSSQQHCYFHTSTPPLNTDPAPSFYDDPSLSYTLQEEPIKNWDEKRHHWLLQHPTLAQAQQNRIVMVSGSQPGPCRNPVGDHLLLRFYKNKADYCRIHGIDLFYNTALLQPDMFSFWAKIPVVRAAMVAHPEAEWIWWVDSDAAFTDMEFEPPMEKYEGYNLVLHGWPHRVEARSWTSLNAGVFLIRNCQWSVDFIDRWARMGPQSPEYRRWGRIQKALFKDKLYAESDDQTGIIYLLLKEKERWGDKIYLENDYYFEGYWVEIVNKLEKIAKTYMDVERRVKGLRRRRAEKVAMAYARMREEYLEKEGIRGGPHGWRRPFVTHFTGCQPCSGDHNTIYSGENCWDGMQRALNFADDQVLRAYGFRHERLVNSTAVRPLPFDFPAEY
ncbi:alpha-6-galactosyltransferase [Iris pallida]|uniref:Alpha-6-galactosyltransferase n=1 Tax=Iris pallida TaxID=29817 RepID=A0AAX6EWC7_IRIPA|nr:alpha-6-galactosyltransferase [Iris pallida]